MTEFLKRLVFGGDSPPTIDISAIQPLKADLSTLNVEKKLVPSDAEYFEARLPWNWSVSGTPSAIAMVKSEQEIQATVNFCRENKLLLCVAGGKHSLYSSINDSMMLNLGEMNKVTVDPVARTALVEGGARLRDLDMACKEFGLAVTAGTNPDTGVGGLTLGGGVGYLHRKFGATIDNLLSVRIVLASGEAVDASADTNPDLFWAVRGSGGNFGVVVNFKFQLHPIGDNGDIIGGAMVYPPGFPFTYLNDDPKSAYLKALEFWKTLPNETCGLGVVNANGPFISVLTHCGPTVEGQKWIDENISKLGKTVINTIKKQNYHSKIQPIAEKEQAAGNHFEKSLVYNEFSTEAAELLWKLTQAGPPRSYVLLFPVGGLLYCNPWETERNWYLRNSFLTPQNYNVDDYCIELEDRGYFRQRGGH